MKNNYAKLFINKSNNKIVKVKYSPGYDDYYTIVKENCTKGYKQIIITSKIMTSVIENYFYTKSYEIAAIEFMEDDITLKKEIDIILTKLKVEKAYFGVLLEKINFLSEESAIDIRSIELKGRNDRQEAINILLQVNGIIGINEKCFEEESEILIKNIERCLV